ncbi:energy transducer TonB [Myroides marinus]|uniref:energy transducer TonB n=1 Tax=Myroides marinus TaxID=703342 RepID=UPI002575BB1F|nr:energy transducer TonB [Myroides marinus]MDM1351321.1 energy transducer TonB [Myroides marinus]MDM1355988.1 energy transducer TonB [Myroides marinus]MDM1358528.1 energy transducer TonB [Myroides marinus]MDM1364185.1 energy transducer TonB [Myroides marinus]MDM1383716.1 energy transducer TonB [Myroides marinus]
MAKNDLFRKDWLDIVFENRNKAYGAYKLRKNSSYTTIMSLVAGIFLFSAVFVIPSVVSNLFASEETAMVDVVYDIPITPKDLDDELFIPKEEPEVELPEEKVETVLSRVKEVKYTEFEAVHASNNTEEPASVDDFIEANPGANNVEANEDGVIAINEDRTDNPAEVAKLDDAREGVKKEEDNKVYLGVSYKAEPYETMTKFSSNFVSKFRTPDIEAGTKEIKVIMSFIVEKDGRLTDIKVLRDPGYGAGQEAIRVLKTMPKWKPALNNDKAVRSQFTLPITIRIQ